MEIFEIINKILSEKNISKREFAQRLIALEPKSNRTGEVISETIIYSYLSGKTAIKAELMPYISDVLGIPEQFLFEESQKSRMKMLKYICQNLSKQEELYLQSVVMKCKDSALEPQVAQLLKYAPPPFLNKIKESLKNIKDITDKV